MITGREEELRLLRQALQDDRSHFIAVYGRRRIGKTFLVREAYEYRFTFQHAGLYRRKKNEQLYTFVSALKESGYTPDRTPQNWLEAFDELKELIRRSTEKKKVIFIDELSWMDTQGSDLMAALEHFWNAWASARKDIILIVCASATSWMLSKVIHNKGGLYNRLTEQIHLRAFSLAECEALVRQMGLALNREQILQGYMIFGGVPYYWGFLQKGKSLLQNVDRMMFAEDAPLKDEYRYLFASIFRQPDQYLKIMRALGQKKVGMTREELIAATGIPNTGDLTKKLTELESCDFIRVYTAYGKKKKDAVYQLMDSFILFYLRFMEKGQTDEHFWENQRNTPAVNTWMGLAFERVCLNHIEQIKKSLGVSGVLSHIHSWACRQDLSRGIFGSQIDLLIVRNDQVINLCEMKYSGVEFNVTEAFERSLNRKIHDLTVSTGTRYAIHPTLITTYGITGNEHTDCLQAVITMDDLFC
ncbi:MAG: AAA family ATPase [Oscillospiraceae bacterium]|nr:AAA family ATPase [Oscillospiraceae bacterium]